MSDVLSPVSGAEGAAAPARDGQAAGQRLRQAREAAGLHVVALAAALKVPVKKLEALEAGRTADLPDATFARALAASVCRQLKIDPAEVLALLPQAASSRLGEDAVLNTPFRYGREGTGPTRAGQGGVPRAVWMALAILLGAGVVWWAVPPASDETVLVTPLEPLAPVPATGGATSMGAGASVAEETAAAPSDASVASAAASAASAAAPAGSATTVTPAVTTAAAAPTATTSAEAAPAAAASGVLVIRTRSDSWVEVSANGKVLLQRVVKAGESVALGEAPPLTVVIGRVDAVEVLVRGQPFDLAGVARNNVARFEVK